jgi:hypothetical protein
LWYLAIDVPRARIIPLIRKENRRMAENVPPVKPGTENGDATAGVPFYEKQRQHLKELITRRRALEKRLVSVEALLVLIYSRWGGGERVEADMSHR